MNRFTVTFAYSDLKIVVISLVPKSTKQEMEEAVASAKVRYSCMVYESKLYVYSRALFFFTIE